MKSLTLFFLAMLIVANIYAQHNHVPNCSFEEYSQCPPANGNTSIYYSTGWRQFNFSHTYYYNSCNTSRWGVPANQDGYQLAAHGNAYASFVTMIGGGDDKSYISRKILPLFPGARYEVSMSVSLANLYGYACDGLGAFFYRSGPDTSIGGTLPVTPQILYAGVVKDTSANWVRLTKTFYADSAYDKIVIGGFLKPANTDYDTVNTSGIWGITYYVDSVVVKLADSFYLNPADSMFCAGDTVSMPYVAIGTYHSDNIFSVQLSDASGSFASPINIGSAKGQTSGSVKCIFPKNVPTGTGYRLRFISSNVKDTALEYGRTYKIGNVVKPVATSNSPVCVTDTLKLFAYTPTAGVTYRWYGSGGIVFNHQNPEIYPIALSNNGEYIVTASLYGCKIKDTTIAAISNNNLVHDFAKSNSPVCTDDTIKLYSEFTVSGATYSWSGPNSFASGLQSNTIAAATVSDAGPYILTVANGGCIVKDTVTVSITTRPSQIIATATSPCENENLTLTVASAFSGYNYVWTGPSNFTALTASSTINNATSINSGDYFVSGYYMGCTLKDTVTVNVKPFPAKPVANTNLVLCAGEPINLFASSSTNGVNYSWIGPSSYTSYFQNPIINNSTTGMSGDYIVSADLNGCKMLDTTNVTIKPSPAAVTLNNNSPICAGATLQLNSTASSTGTTYLWKGPNAFTANTQNGSLTNSAAGVTGWYKMSVNLNGCEYVDSLYAIVHPIPAIPVINYPPLICAGENMQLGTNAVAGASYTWTGANGFNANVQNPVRNNIVTTDAGQYQVTVTVNGCTSAPGTANISINPGPFVVIFSAPADSVCQGERVSFVAIPNNSGNNPQYRWLVNGVQAGTGSTYSTTMLNKGDVVSCAMIENTKCSAPFVDESNDVSLEVLPWLAPSVTITANPSRTLQYNEYVTFTALPVNGGVNPQYQWKRNGQNIVGATGNTWSANTLNDNDKITVELISSYKCPQPSTAGSNSITVKVAGTGVNRVEIVHNLALYPNPNNGQFVLQGYNVSKDMLQISIINAIGQVIYTESKTFEAGNMSYLINAGNMAKGVYMLRINAEHGHNSLRFVVE